MIALLLSLFVGGGALADEPVKIGVLAYRSKAETMKQWQPLEAALKQAIPNEDFVVEALSYDELNLAVAGRQLDFVLTNPGHFVFLNRTVGVSAPLATLVTKEDGQAVSVFGGAIFSRSDRPDIRALADVQGKTVATPSTWSLGAYQMQAYEFNKAGVRLAEDARVLVTDFPQSNVVDAVLSGRADVGLVRSGFLESLSREGKLDLNQVSVLNRQSLPGFPVLVSTRLYPEWPFFSLPHVNEALARQVLAALFLLPEGGARAQSMGIAGFSVPADYTPVADLLRELRMPPFEHAPIFTLRDVWSRYQWPMLAAFMALGLILILGFRLFLTRRELLRQHETVLDQKRRLELSETRFQLAIEGAEEGVWDNDLVTGALYHSPRMYAMLGYDAKELPADFDAWKAIMHPDDWEKLWQRVQFHLDTPGDEYEFVMRLRHRDGGWRWVLTRGRATRDLQGRPVRFTGTHMDITERKLAEEELLRHRDHLEELVAERTEALQVAKEAAEAASRAKSAFLANMSHELRTPMNAIMGMTDLALRRTTDTKQADQLNKAIGASRHLLGVINDILDISKIEADRLVLENIPFDLGAVFDKVSGLLDQVATGKGLQLNMEMPAQLAARSLSGDPVRLGQILINLGSNAIKFTERGSVHIRGCLLDEHEDNLLVRFEVEDTGIGIATADQERLFSAFVQADDSITRKYGGSGLGLAISKRLVQMMGGDIGVNSEPGKGSTFWFTTRLEKNLAVDEMGCVAEGPSAEIALNTSFAGTRVLLAEDEPINQEVSICLLEAVGLQVDLACDGVEAVDKALAVDYAVILMDMMMPRLDGLGATRAIREAADRRHTPIIAMTANAFAEDQERCLAAGMSDFMSKPVAPDQLYAKLLKWLEKRDAS
ncbi:PhnD/SsuA/transferrin family substrate-binding protein [Dechloromonas sp. ARDL1]|uniref:PhnD/SsuA/transferrin family substrate-binding protein n=1 Tax=Dechloromonas sp. ARDL1 TaxID=3322121 RepID=UPI003DA6F17C